MPRLKFTSAIVQWRAEAASNSPSKRSATCHDRRWLTRLGVAPSEKTMRWTFIVRLTQREARLPVISSRLLGSCGIPAKRSRMTIAISVRP